MNETDDSHNVCQMETFGYYRYYKSANGSKKNKTLSLKTFQIRPNFC